LQTDSYEKANEDFIRIPFIPLLPGRDLGAKHRHTAARVSFQFPKRCRAKRVRRRNESGARSVQRAAGG
jgi:hypothetical protein